MRGWGCLPPPVATLKPLDSSPGTTCVANLLFFGPLGRCWQARRGSGTRRRAPRREGVVSCPYRAIARVVSLQPHRRLTLEGAGHKGREKGGGLVTVVVAGPPYLPQRTTP